MVSTRTLFVPFVLAAGALAASPDVGSAGAASGCKSVCDSAVGSLSGCSATDIKCICTDKVGDAYATCYDCAVTQIKNATLTTQFQGIMDSFVQSCKSGGVTVKSQTIRANSALSLHSTVVGATVGLVLVGVFTVL